MQGPSELFSHIWGPLMLGMGVLEHLESTLIALKLTYTHCDLAAAYLPDELLLASRHPCVVSTSLKTYSKHVPWYQLCELLKSFE